MIQKIRRFQKILQDEIVKRNPGLGLDRRAEEITQRFAQDLDERSQILDIGGGWGFYAEPLESRGHSVTVLDVVKSGIQKAPVVIYDPAGPFPFADKTFDVSIIITALHHIPEPLKVIQEAMRVTRRTIIVVEDLYRNPIGKWWTLVRDQIYNFEFFGHPCQFRKQEDWVQLFRGLKLEVSRVESFYTWLSGLRILNGLFVLRLAEDVCVV